MKNSIKEYIKIAIILGLIAGLSGVIIATLNIFTEPLIEENAYNKEMESLNEVFPNKDYNKLDEVLSNNTNNKVNIANIYEAFEKDTETLQGYIFIINGKNECGTIKIVLAINNDGKIIKMVMIENTESDPVGVNNHFNSNYTNKDDLDKNEVNDIDVKCGATKGATLIKEMVLLAFQEYDLIKANR